MPMKLSYGLSHQFQIKFFQKQVCIPVGCVPPVCCPYLPACTAQGKVSAPGGLSSLGSVCSWGVSTPGGCLLPVGGVCIPACTEADTPFPVNRMTDRQV